MLGIALSRAVIVRRPSVPCIEYWRSICDSRRRCSIPLIVRTPGSMDPPPVLAVQTFARNALNRSTPDRRDDQFLHKALPDSLFLLVTGTSVLVRSAAAPQPPTLCWHDIAALRHVGVELAGDHFVISAGAGQPQHLDAHLLGKDADPQHWKFVLTLPGDGSGEVLSQLQHSGAEPQELRALMSQMEMGEVAVAGHAVALAHWHEGHSFCGHCGAPTRPIEAGGKRQCTANSRHREYPRTDPVAIMMVESVDGSRALLGRSKRMRPGMMTCLSGFIEQGESIEEAVAREVKEEAGVAVGAITILGSQPWPIGRGGSCELMIGCMGKATSDDLNFDKDEMDDVRWVSRAEAASALKISEQKKNPYLGGTAQTGDGPGFWVPPPHAIAHHLIKAWVQKQTSWFASSDSARL